MKITDEKAFSVPSDTFAISASETGYTLQYSVDGETFTDWDEEDIPAGENVVVRSTRGLIYKLSGNEGDVFITY